MKLALRMVPILCTLLLVGLGVFMPRLTSLVVDRQLEDKILQKKDAQVSPTVFQSSDFFHTMQLFTSEQSQIKLTEGHYMTQEEVRNKAMEIKFAINNMPYDSGVQAFPNVKPVLIINKNPPVASGVFWCCLWEDGSDKTEVLWLDDKSGQMIAFQLKTRQPTIELSPFPQRILTVSEFCRLNYPVDVVKLAVERESENIGTYTMTLKKENKGIVKTHSIPIRLQDEWLYFNI